MWLKSVVAVDVSQRVFVNLRMLQNLFTVSTSPKEMLKRAHEAVCAISTKVDVKYCLLKEDNDQGLSKFPGSFRLYLLLRCVCTHGSTHDLEISQSHQSHASSEGSLCLDIESDGTAGMETILETRKFSVGGFTCSSLISFDT